MSESELRPEKVIQEAEIEIPAYLRPRLKLRGRLRRGLKAISRVKIKFSLDP